MTRTRILRPFVLALSLLVAGCGTTQSLDPRIVRRWVTVTLPDSVRYAGMEIASTPTTVTLDDGHYVLELERAKAVRIEYDTLSQRRAMLMEANANSARASGNTVIAAGVFIVGSLATFFALFMGPDSAE